LWSNLLLIIEYIAIALGVFFMFVASLGVLRLRDFYMRIHAPTKAATLGLIFLLIAVAIAVREPALVTKAVLAVVFVAVTAPAGAHLLARAAYRNGVPYSSDTRPNEYDRYARERERARALPPPAQDLQTDDESRASTA
jgi:multicomponent Na+:H+ antiporter subunit G